MGAGIRDEPRCGRGASPIEGKLIGPLPLAAESIDEAADERFDSVAAFTGDAEPQLLAALPVEQRRTRRCRSFSSGLLLPPLLFTQAVVKSSQSAAAACAAATSPAAAGGLFVYWFSSCFIFCSICASFLAVRAASWICCTSGVGLSAFVGEVLVDLAVPAPMRRPLRSYREPLCDERTAELRWNAAAVVLSTDAAGRNVSGPMVMRFFMAVRPALQVLFWWLCREYLHALNKVYIVYPQTSRRC